jgi:hypothetical protein
VGQLLVGLLLHLGESASAPRVVDEDVERTVLGQCRCDGVLDLAPVGDVRRDEEPADLVRDGSSGGFVEFGDDHARALVGKAPRDSGADACTCAGDECDSSG